MSISEVTSALHSSLSHIPVLQKRKHFNKNYTACTQHTLINPILKALGWDLSNPHDCYLQYTLNYKKDFLDKTIDYVLLDTNSNPAVLIETKSMYTNCRRPDPFRRLARYLYNIPTANIAIVTNGLHWIFLTRCKADWQTSNKYTLTVHNQSIHDNAKYLHNILSKDNVINNNYTPPTTNSNTNFIYKIKNRFSKNEQQVNLADTAPVYITFADAMMNDSHHYSYDASSLSTDYDDTNTDTNVDF